MKTGQVHKWRYCWPHNCTVGVPSTLMTHSTSLRASTLSKHGLRVIYLVSYLRSWGNFKLQTSGVTMLPVCQDQVSWLASVHNYSLMRARVQNDREWTNSTFTAWERSVTTTNDIYSKLFTFLSILGSNPFLARHIYCKLSIQTLTSALTLTITGETLPPNTLRKAKAFQ